VRESEAQFVDSDVYTLTFEEVGIATTTHMEAHSERVGSRCCAAEFE
jgi:hypothetical protein